MKGLADWFVAARALALEGDEWARAAAMLGYELAPQKAPVPAGPKRVETSAAPSLPPSPVSPTPPPAITKNEVWIDPVSTSTSTAPPAYLQGDVLPASEPKNPPPAPDPLFVPEWTRAILHALAEEPRPDGEIDLDRLMDEVTRGRAIERIPRRVRRVLAGSLRVMLDVGTGMQPFLQDIRQLARGLARLVPRSAVEWETFDGAPFERGRALVMPAQGTVVLVASDMASNGDAWTAFAEDLAAIRCPLVLVVPFSPARLPLRLRRRAAAVMWDRTTNASLIRKARIRQERVCGG